MPLSELAPQAPATGAAAPPAATAPPPTLSLPAAVPPVPSRVVRAVLAATRVAPGDRALVAGPNAADLAAVLEHLGLRVSDAPDGNTAFEAAVWCGPDAAAGDADLAALAPHVRPGRQAVGLRRCDDLTAPRGPEAGVRFADRGRFGFPAGRGGWALHTAPGRAAQVEPTRIAAAA